MGPSLPHPNAEHAYALWQRGEHVTAHWDPVALERGRRRRVIPATIGLAIGLRLIPLLVLAAIVIATGR
jgi:hypothetical protein